MIHAALDFIVTFLFGNPEAGLLFGLTLVNLSGFQYGVASAETGINISSFRARVAPEFKTFALNKDGEKRGFAVGAPELTVTIEGEVSGGTGVMAAVVATATTIANSTSYFGAPSTGKYLNSGEVTETRDGFKSVSLEFSANNGIS
jgi:hypothetical protein